MVTVGVPFFTIPFTEMELELTKDISSFQVGGSNEKQLPV